MSGGTQSLLRWINTVRINEEHGSIVLKLHEDMIPFLLQLKGKYLDYKLYYVLAMKSRYGIRIYELLKAEHNRSATTFEKKREQVSIINFELEYLKKITVTESYTKFNNFRNRVLEPAKHDINEYSDLIIDYEPIKEGYAYKTIRFFIRYKKTVPEGLDTMQKVEQVLNNRKSETPLIPDGAFCNNCDLQVDGVCQTLPYCGKISPQA